MLSALRCPTDIAAKMQAQHEGASRHLSVREGVVLPAPHGGPATKAAARRPEPVVAPPRRRRLQRDRGPAAAAAVPERLACARQC